MPGNPKLVGLSDSEMAERETELTTVYSHSALGGTLKQIMIERSKMNSTCYGTLLCQIRSKMVDKHAPFCKYITTKDLSMLRTGQSQEQEENGKD